MSKQIFALRYDIQAEPGHWTKDQLGTKGGTDAFIIQSLIFPPDGSFSFTMFTSDGRTGGPVTAADMFRAWIAQAAGMLEGGELPHWQEAVCAEALQSVRSLMGLKAILREPLDDVDVPPGAR